jgi:predicted ATPase
MISKIEIIKDFRCFKKGDTFTFRPGVNLLVGEQGTGKSTILDRIKIDGKTGEKPEVALITATKIHMMAFDFEKDTPRGKGSFDDSKPFNPQLACLFLSHGQVNNFVLEELSRRKNILFLMDEPDMALSIRSVHKLVAHLKTAAQNGCQVLASVHNPIVIEAFDEVLSFEHRQWMSSKEFIKSHESTAI